jgi:hypothetical protein
MNSILSEPKQNYALDQNKDIKLDVISKLNNFA